MMGRKETKEKTISKPIDFGFTDIVFSWSLEDILNEEFYKDKVNNIPNSFESVQRYLESYVNPLLEETRAQLCSSMEVIPNAPYSEIISLEESKPYGTGLYDVRVDEWKNRFTDRGKEPYKTLPGDVFILADVKPETVSDLQREGRSWTFVSVTRITEDEGDNDRSSTYFKVKALKDLGCYCRPQKSMFLVFLVNITPNRRIFNALHMFRNLKMVEEVLCPNSVVKDDFDCCCGQIGIINDDRFNSSLYSEMNESQRQAVLSCLYKVHCNHKSAVELIWGPPGTGKTKTVSFLLLNLLKRKFRTLACAPTNVAIVEVALRVVRLVNEMHKKDKGSDTSFCSVGSILLFGNKERLKVGSDIKDIYLDDRIERLTECFGAHSGWRCCFASMIDFLEDCVSHYAIFVENEMIVKSQHVKNKKLGENSYHDQTYNFNNWRGKSFLQFTRERFASNASSVRSCIMIFLTHIPEEYILENNVQNMASLVSLLNSFESLLFQDTTVFEALDQCFSHIVRVEDLGLLSSYLPDWFKMKRTECLSALKDIQRSLNQLKLPSVTSREAVAEFCFQQASLVLCTASSSYKLYAMSLEPMDILVIDEAAQLKECESCIPLQLPDVKHAILIGDEWQLPAMVESRVSDEAGFGRSLFERLSSLGHSKHLLNMQYRMHPSISLFPNFKFYSNLILDGPNVRRKNYEKHYLPGPMFGPYSFINVIGGREEMDDIGHSRRNMVEVAVMLKLLQKLRKAWAGSEERLSIGVISPYRSQVVAIQEKLGRKYDDLSGFSVKVKSVDGFQGGEEDIIIISTVRSNSSSSIGFISNPQRANVALTRARHCMWILGSEKTLAHGESVWEALVIDAKNRRCFFNADEDKDLVKVILEVKKELDQFDDLLNQDSLLFRNSRWKVLFSDRFLKSFKRLSSVRTKKFVLNLLLKLASGWRPKYRNLDSVCGSSSGILKQFKVEGLYVVCATDIVKETFYTQVLKIWDILPLENIPKLVSHLDGILSTYTDDFMNRCKEKCIEGKLEVPKTFVTSSDIVRFKNYEDDLNGNNFSSPGCNSRSFVENSKVSDSLLLMKFYNLSSSVVNHLLSDRDGVELDLPFEVTDEELKIILYPRSTFILGRSGTGKTTVLTMKLFQKEKLHHLAAEAYGVENHTIMDVHVNNEFQESLVETEGSVLRQLFVTVSPKLCHAVRQHVLNLKSFVCGSNNSAGNSSISLEEIDDVAVQFMDIPDSFTNLPTKSYPLVITFQKFLMMLDGTLGNSYFGRFQDARKLLCGSISSSRSVALQTFIKNKEVNFDCFSSSYWPRFNSQQTKKLDCSRVFTEIISHIKGDPRASDSSDGKLSREDYVLLSKSRISGLSAQKREIIYDIFQNYERMKMKNGEFDLGDFVIDLHRRLRDQRYEGDEIDFVYIDEVQDLTMNQIALFKYICRNVEEGFVFSGDTAQTIARGIDFRFQDIKSLFYKRFIFGNEPDKENFKGQISEIFHLSQNFRTHAGILNLSETIVELMYHFFPQSVDPLKPETSLIYGEAPFLLKSGDSEDVIVRIFGNSDRGQNIVGFGADQVILVRDETTRNEIVNYVGKQALVLTILECKGLEFQDVLLYNFFGSSPLQNQWRVIYKYMEEQDMLDSSSPKFFPCFSESKHNILCSELKQLYVAVTRTRQRLWFCENNEEHSKPMFDYWKKKCVVQVRELDDSLACTMQVASSQEEWKSRGIKLYHEHNYEMATMCFERAGDLYWERRSMACGHKAIADRMRSVNPEKANVILREAALIFESIGKGDFAAQCFFELGEFEKAGRIYVEKCGVSELYKAGECFSLADCYELAADVYARGNFFSECLNVCSRGKLFDMGLRYIQYWKDNAPSDGVVIKGYKDVEKIEQEFLESCARHYHNCADNRSMMRFVKAFHSTILMRNFLKSLDCLDELLLLEEELGNFSEAAEIANLKGDILREVDLLGMAGKHKEACTLILHYVLAFSLWSSGSKGWPLKNFKQKEELLSKAKSFAKNHSNDFFEYVCTEADILSNEKRELIMMKEYLSSSQKFESVRGEMLSVRKLLDFHFHLNASKYTWEDKFVSDLSKRSKETICQNKYSVETMVCFWNRWSGQVFKIFESLGCLKTHDADEYDDFCLSFFGVRRQVHYQKVIYSLLITDAEWVKEARKFIRTHGKMVSLDVSQFISSASSYWSSELLTVGLNVLEKLDLLYKFIITNNSLSVYCRSAAQIHIFEIAKFLLEAKHLDCKYRVKKILNDYVERATEHFFSFVFPLDWRISSNVNMISLRRTDVARDLLRKAIVHIISSKNKQPTYGQIGRVVMTVLGSVQLDVKLFENIVKWLGDNEPWKVFIKCLSPNVGSEFQDHPVQISGSSKEVHLLWKFHEATVDTYNANWIKEYDYISPFCFFYLIERLLISVCSLQGYFVTTKSSFVEWLTNQQWDTNKNPSLVSDIQLSFRSILWFWVDVIRRCLYDQDVMILWIEKSGINVKEYYPGLVLRLVLLVCLLHVNFGMCLDLLYDLVGKDYIIGNLPAKFVNTLRRRRKPNFPPVDIKFLAEFFKKVENPMVIVKLGESLPQLYCPDAIFVDMKVERGIDDILKALFPKIDEVEAVTKVSSNDYEPRETSKVPSSSTAISKDLNVELKNNRIMVTCDELWGVVETLKRVVENEGDQTRTPSNASETIKMDVEMYIKLLTSAITTHFQDIPSEHEDRLLLEDFSFMLDELKQLSAALDLSNQEVTIEQLSKSLLSKRTKLDPLISQLLGGKETTIDGDASGSSIPPAADADEERTSNVERDPVDNSKVEEAKTVVASETQSNNQRTGNKGKRKPRKSKKRKGKKK